MRIILAAVAGGIAMFVWSSISHMALPIGTIGVKSLPNDTVVMESLRSNVKEPGFYFYPAMPSENPTEAEMAAWTEKYKAGPHGLMIHHPAGAEVMTPGMLGTELLSNILACLFGAIVMSWLICSFFGRVAAAGMIGLAGWLSIEASYWNWYGFPTNYVLAQGVDQVVGWLAAGVVMALIIKRRD